jgi:hypothetical protein
MEKLQNLGIARLYLRETRNPFDCESRALTENADIKINSRGDYHGK